MFIEATSAGREREPLLRKHEDEKIEAQPNDQRNSSLYRIIAAGGVYIFAVALTLSARPALILTASGGNNARATVFKGIVDILEALAGGVAAPILGSLADTHGRVPVVQICAALEAIALALIALSAHSLSGQFVGYLLISISASSSIIFAAAIADLCTEPTQATQAYAHFGGVLGAALLLGPTLGGAIAASISTVAPIWFASFIFVLCIPVFGYSVRETRVINVIDHPPSLAAVFRSSQWQNPLLAIRSTLFKNHALTLLIVANVLYSMAESAVMTVLFMYANLRVGWGAQQFGMFVSSLGLMLMVSQLLAPTLVKLLGERVIIVTGYLFAASHLIVFAMADRSWLIWFGLLMVLPSCISYPAQKAVLARQVDPEQQGQLQGSMSSINSLLKPIAILICASLFAATSSFAPGAVFILASGVMFIAAIVVSMALLHPELK